MVHARASDLPAAIEDFREAIRRDPTLSLPHQKLAHVLHLSNATSEAVAPAREAVRLDPKNPWVWSTLGVTLAFLHEDEEASRDFDEALKLYPDNPEFLCNSGTELLRLGDFTAGLEKLRRGHELGSKLPSWNYPSANWVTRAERLVALEKRLESVESGKGKRPSADELVELAEKVCRPKKNFAQASALYARAFDEEPGLKLQRSASYLHDAAAAAVSASLGKGADAPPGEAERARLRKLARGWLEEELVAVEEILHHDATRRSAVAEILKPWTSDPSFAALREAAPGAGIPEDEIAAWKALWKRSEALLEPR
jgi:tetratricopeptide (TPR) repeat protein